MPASTSRPTVTDLVVDSSSDGSGVVNVGGPISVDGAGHGVGSPKRTVLDSGQHPSAKKSNRFDILQDAGNDLIGSDSAKGVGEMDNLPDDLFDAPAEGLASVMAAIAADFSVVAPQVSSSPSISLSKGNVGKVGDNCPARKNNVKFRNSGVQGVARIVLGWDPNLLGVSLVFSNFRSPQLLCVQVSCLESQKVFYVSSGYGANSMIDRGLSGLL